MPAATVKDLTLVLDADRGRYTTTLSEGWPGNGQQPIDQPLDGSLFDQLAELVKASSDERFGEVLFDWILPPQSKIRRAFLRHCEDGGQQKNLVRLWIGIGSRLAADPYFQLFERVARVSWEGFWVREWADEAQRPPRVQSPFLALNPWITILRCPPGITSVQRRFTVASSLHVLLIASNPPPGVSPRYSHIEYLGDMVTTAWDIFHKHKGIGWVSLLREPTKVEIATAIREYKPHVVIYVGHGYAKVDGSGLVLAKSEGGGEFEEVSGLRKGLSESQESQLEQVLAGKAEALSKPDVHDEGLRIEERPRLFVALACEAAPAAPALLQCGVPAVLAMRQQILDHLDTVTMVQNLLTFLVEQEKPVDTGLIDLRQSLMGTRPHWSVPVLHLATKDGLLFPDEEQFARGEYIRHMRQRCGRFERTFRDSPMNELADRSYQRQTLGEWVKEKVPTPQGLQGREVEHQREFREALRLHRKVVVIGRAGRGKTSLLYWAVLTFLTALEDDRTAVVPVYVPLKDWQEAGDLQAYLRGKFSDERIFNWLWGHIQKGNVLLLLDALDEVPREARMKLLNARGILADLVRTFTAPQARIVLTCRDSVYAEVSERLSELKRRGEKEGFVKLELKQFKREQIVAYAKQFFDDEAKTQAFLRDIEDPRGRPSEGERSPCYTHLAEEPLYLHMLCWLWAGMGEVRFQLPAAEDDLWRQSVVRLLEQRDISEEQAKDHLRLLEELAFHCRLCGKLLTLSSVEDTATWLAKEKDFSSPRDKAQRWLVDLEQWELLLRRGSGSDAIYEFAIPTLDEYFAARHLVARWAEGDEKYRTWLPCSESWWERGMELYCPNPYCRSTLPSFCDLLRQAEHEEIFLLMVGLLKEAEWEEVFLKGIRSDCNLALKALSRCRYTHAGTTLDVLKSLVTLEIGVSNIIDTLSDGLAAVGRARVRKNLDPILNYYVRTLRNQEERIRQRAGAALVHLGDAAVKPLIAALRDEDEGVRRIAARALGQIRDARAVRPLIAALRDEKIPNKVVYLLLEEIGGVAVEPLIVALKGEDERVRQYAAIALGRIGDGRAVKPLIAALLKDKSDEVRSEAAAALGKIGDARAVEPLIAALGDNSQVDSAGWYALTRFGDVAVRPLIAALRNKHARSMACLALSDIGSAAAVGSLVEVLRRDKDAEVRFWAAAVLLDMKKVVPRNIVQLARKEMGLRPLGGDEDKEFTRQLRSLLWE